MLKRFSFVAFAIAVFATFGCGEETDETLANSTDASVSGSIDGGNQPADTGTTSMDASTDQRDVDPQFTNTVLPMLLMQCGAGCHLRVIDASNNGQVGGNNFEIWGEDVQGSRGEILHPSFVNLDSIEDSEILIHHNGGRFFETDNNKSVLREWLAGVALEDS